MVCLAVTVYLTPALFAKSLELNGVKYTTHGKTASIRVADGFSSILKDLFVEETVYVDGKYYTVTEIESGGFAECRNLKTVNLPNSIVKIGSSAFVDCTNLESAVIPDYAKVETPVGFYSMVDTRSGFAGCRSLQDVRGNNGSVPDYAISKMLKDCNEVPFVAVLRNNGGSSQGNGNGGGNSYMSYSGNSIISFTDYAKNIITPKLNAWQARKEYETAAQWHDRVNEATRELKISQLLDEVRADYVSRYSPKSLKGYVGAYDPDYNIYTISTGEMGNIYVKVPQEEAESFKNNWKNVKIEPTYGINDNQLQVVECKFYLNNRIYNSAKVYDTDDIDRYDYGFQSLESYFAEADKKDNSGSIPAPTNVNRHAKSTGDPVDIDIPSTGITNDRTFALIIGNENYQRNVPNVDYAVNDANVFAKYCEKTLGLPQNNIRKYLNATYGDMLAAMKDIESISKAFKGDIKVILYYAGHGMPDESTLEAYLLPVDCDGSSLEAAYPLRKLYDTLGKMKTKGVTVFLDACFSGASRSDDMLDGALASRGVRLKPRDIQPIGNMIVMSASTGKQTAFPYKEKGHGMFTYFLLDKLRQTQGKVTLGDLFEHVCDGVSQQSVVINSKPQVPTLTPAASMLDTWDKLMLR